jgi:hypothetical protein
VPDHYVHNNSPESHDRKPSRRLRLYFAIAILVWIKAKCNNASQSRLGYLLFSTTVCITIYLCLRHFQSRARQHSRAQPHAIAATSKSSIMFYSGFAAIVLSAALITISLSFRSFSDTLMGYALCCFSLGFLYAWLGAYQVRLSSSAIEYWSLLDGYHLLLWKQITQVRLTHGTSALWGKHQTMPIRIELITQANGPGPSFSINAKVFDSATIARILAATRTSLPEVRP